MMLAYVAYSCLLTPSDVRVNPCQKLFRDEWLGNEVVCSGFETGAFGCSISLSAEQQHGHVVEAGIRPKSATHLESVPPRQSDVEQHDIGNLGSYQRINVVSVGYCLQLHIPARQGVRQCSGDAWLVVDKQDARHARMLAAWDGLFRYG
jgi:hypothetical protein